MVETLNWSVRHLPMAVLTNKPARATEVMLEGLGLRRYFRDVIGGDTALGRKPAPAGLMHLASDGRRRSGTRADGWGFAGRPRHRAKRRHRDLPRALRFRLQVRARRFSRRRTVHRFTARPGDLLRARSNDFSRLSQITGRADFLGTPFRSFLVDRGVQRDSDAAL